MLKKILNVFIVIAICVLVISLFFVESFMTWFSSIALAVTFCGGGYIILLGLIGALFPIVQSDDDYAKIVLFLLKAAFIIGTIILTFVFYYLNY